MEDSRKSLVPNLSTCKEQDKRLLTVEMVLMTIQSVGQFEKARVHPWVWELCVEKQIRKQKDCRNESTIGMLFAQHLNSSSSEDPKTKNFMCQVN
jgi:hypothetical protein